MRGINSRAARHRGYSRLSAFSPLPLFLLFFLFAKLDQVLQSTCLLPYGVERRCSHSYAAYVAANELISNAVMTQAVMAVMEQFSRLPLSLVADLSAPPGKFCAICINMRCFSFVEPRVAEDQENFFNIISFERET